MNIVVNDKLMKIDGDGGMIGVDAKGSIGDLRIVIVIMRLQFISDSFIKRSVKRYALFLSSKW